jgi:PhnB protein
MASAVKPIPDGYHTITPNLVCRNAERAIEFYKTVFGANELMRMPGPGGKIMHAELKIGNSILFVNDELTQPGSETAPRSGAPSVSLFLYVEDVDAVFNRALSAGAKVDMPLQDMFWGDRFGKISDPSGHVWGLATHKEDVAPAELERRSASFTGKTATQS